ncbi:MAG: ABC transporter permease [Azospirillaceae bacterium]
MTEAIEIFATASFWAAVLRIATPLIFGTLGELICERAGVLNLGIEGIMTFGAMVGWMTVYQGGDLALGLAAAAAGGGLFGLLHAALTVPLGLSQHVSGLGITLFASSLTYYSYRLILPGETTPPSIEPFTPVDLGFLSDLPLVGPSVFTQTPPVYLALAMVPAVAWILYRTPLGLAVRMVGENPHGAEAQGLDVFALRIGAVVVGSAMMALGGAFLTLAAFDSFFFTMIQGRGWVCIALVVFASWHPGKALLGALLYGLFDAYQLRLQHVVSDAIPYQVFLMMPYLLSILALVVMARRAAYPRALMRPYRRGER